MNKWLRTDINKWLFNFPVVSCAMFCLIVSSCNNSDSTVQNTYLEYDSVLASNLGADEYGMKKYIVAFLESGPNKPIDSLEAASLQKEHLENISRMAAEGSLVLAGPFLDDNAIRGIYIFNVETTEEAEVLIKTDPAIKYGSLKMTLRPWYGSAALMQVNQVHEVISRDDVAD
jgi:uncharacterized protein YciI